MRDGRNSTEHIPFHTLVFDVRIQRALIPARVKWLFANWKLLDVGFITVSIRADGKAYVIDGQHRVRAAMERGLGTTKVKCDVFRGLTIEEEARKFLALNNSRTVSAFDKYVIGLIALDPVYLGIREILERHGLKITRGTGEGSIRCIDKVIAIYTSKDGPKRLDEVCSTLVESWGTRAAAFEQVVLAAMGVVLARYNGELDRSAFSKKLSGYRGGPAALAGDARGLADYKPITVTRAAAEIMVDTYNKGRRGGQVSPL